MATRSRTTSKQQAKRLKKPPVAPARLPGLNFDTFEGGGGPVYEGAHGTDRAPTYQSRYAASAPRRYVRKILSWIRGRPSKSYKARRARGTGMRRRALGGRRVRGAIRRRARASKRAARAMLH